MGECRMGLKCQHAILPLFRFHFKTHFSLTFCKLCQNIFQKFISFLHLKLKKNFIHVLLLFFNFNFCKLGSLSKSFYFLFYFKFELFLTFLDLIYSLLSCNFLWFSTHNAFKFSVEWKEIVLRVTAPSKSFHCLKRSKIEIK